MCSSNQALTWKATTLISQEQKPTSYPLPKERDKRTRRLIVTIGVRRRAECPLGHIEASLRDLIYSQRLRLMEVL